MEGRTMFTLKITDDNRTVDRPMELWFPAIGMVSVIWRGTNQSIPSWESYGTIENYLVDGAPGQGQSGGVTYPVSMICVIDHSCKDDARMRYMLVNRAWLLGPSGETIDRVSP